MPLNNINDDIIVHIYKIHLQGDCYKIIACGNKYLIEKYLKHELQVTELEWERSKLTSGRIISNFCKGNRIVARDSFLIKMEYVCHIGTRRVKPIAEAQKRGNE